MLRKRAVALAISLMFPVVAPALGLGTLKASSALNQPFEGKIEILGAQPGDFDALTIKLADTAQFDRAGLARDAVLLALKFEVVSNPKGNDYIRVFTRDAVREPYLDFLVELNWAQGRMVREYTVLLDPPLYDPNRRQAAQAPKVTPAPAVPRSPAPVARAPAPVSAPPAVSAGTIGPIATGETLWALAQQHKPANVSVQQMMLALLRANPEGFPTGNINMLRKGAVLKVPSAAELAALSRSEAATELTRQTQLWQEYRQGAAKRLVPQQPRTAEAAAAPDSRSKPADAHLEIVAPKSKTEAAGGGGKELGDEHAAAQSDQTLELKARLDEAEDIIDLLQRQVQLKDEELAKLQSSQAGVPAQASEPTAPATVSAQAAPEPAAEAASAPAAPTVVPEASAPAKSAAPKPPAPAAPAVVPEQDEGFLDQLLPQTVRDLVPGGAITVFGILGSLLALLILGLSKLRGRGTGAPKVPQTSATSAVAAVEPSVVDSPREIPDDGTQTLRMDELSDTLPPASAIADPHARTIEAPAETLSVDPLEEVNVYLAYERFDQAEELVRKVIAQYPSEPRYQLRLLEIFYSANNLPAYEQAARDFSNKFGQQDSMWSSVVAMWDAMSPQRELFAPGVVTAAVSAAASAAIVDITADANGPNEVDGPIETTHVSLFGATTMEREPQAAPTADSLFPEMLDLTAGEPDDGEILDLTATVEKLEQAGFLAPGSATAPAADDVFDISGEETAAQSGDNGQLLDLTSTADVFDVMESGNAEAESLTRTATGGGLDAAAAEAVGDEIDFDIGDLGDFDLDATNSPLDLGAAHEDDGALDFDISGLADETNEQAHESTVVMTTSQAGSGSEVVDELDFNLDLPEPESVSLTAAEDESDLQLVTLDDEDGELDFDLSIDDTSSVPDLYLDDTAEVPKSKMDTSLRDLSAELEASIAALNGTGDHLEAADLEFDLSAPEFETGAAESLDLDLTIDRTGEHATAAPASRGHGEDDHAGTGFHDDDEADSKLNLAKAYIELGENEAARAILLEVKQDGSVNQQDEAGRLLAQIS